MSKPFNISETPALDALSTLDGRYLRETAPLRLYFSESALTRDRLRIEIEYLLALSREAHLVRSISEAEEVQLRKILAEFDSAQAQEVKTIERSTRHDVKALEYYLRSKLASTSMTDLVEWLHFGLTSEDVNSCAQALELRESRDSVILPALDAIVSRLTAMAAKNKATPMLGRTHGQPAVPTTLGKELAVFLSRLKKQRRHLADHRFEAKLTGAVGNLNALQAAAPEVDWLAFSSKFIRSLDLEPNLITTQVLPYDNWVQYFDALRLVNCILQDLAQDLWRYISDDYLQQRMEPGEVGSSTMPQKVNPVDVENAEGNLGIANALFAHYANKLPISRLQRDLSDSTVRRSFGTAIGHSLVAYLTLLRGLERLEANESRLQLDLTAHQEVVAEGAQTILRAAGFSDAYEAMKALTRGRRLTQSDFEAWVNKLDVAETVKERLRALDPTTYVGLAEQIVETVIAES